MIYKRKLFEDLIDKERHEIDEVTKSSDISTIFQTLDWHESINWDAFHEKYVTLAYLDNKAEIIDLLVFSTFLSEKIDFNIVTKHIAFLDKLTLPVFPITADYLKLKYNFSESKELGSALKKLEEIWLDNDFIIDKNEIKNILKLS